jgi:thioesterase domain-containing protein
MVAYYNIWAESRGLPGNLLLLRYEDVHADTAAALKKMLAFIGIGDMSDAAIAKAIEQNKIERVRAREQAGEFATKRLQPGIKGDPESLKARKGKVGGWREYISDAEGAKIAAYAAKHLDPWYGYGALSANGTA